MLLTGIAIVGLVFTALLLVATAVGSILFFANRPGTGVRRVGRAIGTVCGSLLLVLLILGIGAGSFATIRRARHPAPPHLKHAEKLPPYLRDKSVPPHLRQMEPEVAEIPVDALLPPSDTPTNPGERPAWVDAGEVKQGDATYVVISSQQFATVDEARDNIKRAARTQLLADFEKTYGNSTKLLSGRLSDETLRTLAVRQEFVETVNRDFGSFTAPMHRFWWQIELSPAVRSELYPMWRSKEQEIRTMVVAGNLALATIGLVLVSWFTRRKTVIPDPVPARPVSAAVLGLGAAALLAERCKRWWK